MCHGRGLSTPVLSLVSLKSDCVNLFLELCLNLILPFLGNYLVVFGGYSHRHNKEEICYDSQLYLYHLGCHTWVNHEVLGTHHPGQNLFLSTGLWMLPSCQLTNNSTFQPLAILSNRVFLPMRQLCAMGILFLLLVATMVMLMLTYLPIPCLQCLPAERENHMNQIKSVGGKIYCI